MPRLDVHDMTQLQPARGTRDIIGEDQRRFAHVVETARRIAGLYGLAEWQTPVFEDTRVFARTLGDTSDVVSKEMYSFEDRGGEGLTLRPEGTAGICRALVAYFSDVRDRLSDDSRDRLERNPLRILDSKDPGDRALVAGAPAMDAHLTQAARTFFDDVRRALDRFGVPFRHNPLIVRGLDYYSHTAFEFVTDRLGAQGTVMAGGRYDGLVEQMGGPATPAVGWAAGIERLSMLMDAPPAAPASVAVMPVEAGTEDIAVDVLRLLREGGIRAEMAYSGNAKKRYAHATRIGARLAVLVGDGWEPGRLLTLKVLGAPEQEEVPVAEIVRRLHERLA